MNEAVPRGGRGEVASESSNLWFPRVYKNRVSSVGGWGKWVSLQRGASVASWGRAVALFGCPGVGWWTMDGGAHLERRATSARYTHKGDFLFLRASRRPAPPPYA